MGGPQPPFKAPVRCHPLWMPELISCSCHLSQRVVWKPGHQAFCNKASQLQPVEGNTGTKLPCGVSSSKAMACLQCMGKKLKRHHTLLERSALHRQPHIDDMVIKTYTFFKTEFVLILYRFPPPFLYEHKESVNQGLYPVLLCKWKGETAAN